MLIVILIFALIGLLATGLLVFVALRALCKRTPDRGKKTIQACARALLGVCVLLAAVQVYSWTLGRPSDDERDVSRVYRNFSYAMNAKDYALAFKYMTPEYKKTHSPTNLPEAFPFLAPMLGEPSYLPAPKHEVHVSGRTAWLHPSEVGWFDLMAGPTFHFEKIHVPCSSNCAGHCYAKWYIKEKYDWSVD